MRLVTIDNGNSNPNFTIHENGKSIEQLPLEKYKPDIQDFVLISSVGKSLALKPSFDLKTKRSANAFFEMPVHYAQTLGDDRLIAAYGIYKKLEKNKKVLLIDAGTFMTCDLISNDGFLGGFIFPGVERFLKTYAESAQLPLLSFNDFIKVAKAKVDLPQTTEAAILGAATFYFESVVSQLIEKHSPDMVILTGGSAGEISSLINSKVRFELAHHLIHSSLRQIFELHLRASI